MIADTCYRINIKPLLASLWLRAFENESRLSATFKPLERYEYTVKSLSRNDVVSTVSKPYILSAFDLSDPAICKVLHETARARAHTMMAYRVA